MFCLYHRTCSGYNYVLEKVACSPSMSFPVQEQNLTPIFVKQRLHAFPFLFANFSSFTFASPFQAHSQNCDKRLLASSCTSVRPSASPNGTTWLPLDGISWNLIFEYFSKVCWENSSFIKIWRLHQSIFARSRTVFFSLKSRSNPSSITEIKCRQYN